MPRAAIFFLVRLISSTNMRRSGSQPGDSRAVGEAADGTAGA